MADHAGAPKRVIHSDPKLNGFNFSVSSAVGRGTFIHQSDHTLNPSNIMGDKSPKSQQKNKNQKQTKTDASNRKKAQAIASKQSGNLTTGKKK